MTDKKQQSSKNINGIIHVPYKYTRVQRIYHKRTLVMALSLVLYHANVSAVLPVPSANFIHAGEGLAVMQSDGVNMVIKQQSDRAIFNWNKFNVGRDNSVTFKQPRRSSVALNRILGDVNASQIMGALKANGRVYLYNQNGIIFGKNSRVNVGSLVATTLNIDTSQFFKSALTNAIENKKAAFFDITGSNTGEIKIQPGAVINATNPAGGRILIIASKIINAGQLSSPDGQTVLAASSDKVYLAASDKDPSLRGLLVEVKTGGSVTNLGRILAARGNISLIGLAVNQSGYVRATTSVNKNGSIRLLARDNAVLKTEKNIGASDLQAIGVTKQPTAGNLAVAKRGGSVILGRGSVTEIVADNDTKNVAPDAQKQLQSKVEIVGKSVWIQRDASIIAPSGNVEINATATPADPTNNTVSKASYVYLDKGSVINVSGTRKTVLPMARNSLAVEVRSNELAGSPLQRNGVLKGQTVYVDLRKSTRIIDDSGARENIQKTVIERLSRGGQINIHSDGDVVQQKGSLMDVSGGKITYISGFIKETQLISNMRVFSLSQANKNRRYDAILGVETKPHPRWAVTETFRNFSGLSSGTFVKGFVAGHSAGAVNIRAASVLLTENGIKAGAIVGPFQRGSSKRPFNGALNVDLRTKIGTAQGVSFLPQSLVDKVIGTQVKAPDPVTFQRSTITGDLVLPDTYLSNSRLGVLKIDTNGMIIINKNAAINGYQGASIDLTGSGITLNGRIISHAGNVLLNAVPIKASGIIRADITVGDNAVIDTSAYWVNDSETSLRPDISTPRLINGGNISFWAKGNVVLQKGSFLNASGSAWLDANKKLTAGKGGDITLIANAINGSSIVLNAKLESYGLYQGGKLSIDTSSILLKDSLSSATSLHQLVLGSQFFESGGFSQYALTANAGNFIVDTTLQPQIKNLQFMTHNLLTVGASPALNDLILRAPTGTPFRDLTRVVVLPEFLRHPVTLAFNLIQTSTQSKFNLAMAKTASIWLDKGAVFNLNSDTSILMSGSINAPGGQLDFNINAPAHEIGFLPGQGIWLGAGSRINVSSSFTNIPNDQLLRKAKIFDAGSVTLNAKRGYVIIQHGASIDVSAKTVTLDLLNAVPGKSVEFQPFVIAPKAGRVSVRAAEGIIVDGNLYANAANSPGAKGGEFDIAMDVGGRGITTSENVRLSGMLKKFNFNSRDIVFSESTANRLTDSVQPGDAIASRLNGSAYIDIAKIQQAGFDTFHARTAHVITDTSQVSPAEIRFESDLSLSLRNSISLNAPIINVNNHIINLQAAYFNLGSDTLTRNSISIIPSIGGGRLSLQAAQIDVTGDVDITAAADIQLNAKQDIRFIGAPSVQVPDKLTGALNTAANITLTARQLYPVTNSQFSLNLLNNAAGIIRVSRVGEQTPVLSAAGSLTLNAPVIEQGGVIKAPLGTIVLKAASKVRLLPGSITTVSAQGQLIPYGITLNAGTSWNYNINGHVVRAKLPEKSISLSAPNIDMQTGSTLDLSGGGNAIAWEFVSGPGGKFDVLLKDKAAKIDNTDGAFAIFPKSKNHYAPVDFLLSNSNDTTAGKQIYFAGGRGIEAGFYSILPARYALLPGAKLVTPVSGESNIYPEKTLTRVDGTPIHAGKYGVANTGIIDSRWSAFVIENGSIARTRSQYIDTLATNFFPQNTPADAGVLTIDAINTLSLSAAIKGDHVAGARGSRLDILAKNIEVVDHPGHATRGFIRLVADSLNKLGVDSLMLGGNRHQGNDGTTVSVRSNKIIIREKAQLKIPELLLVAKNLIETRTGSLLDGSGVSSSKANTVLKLDNNASIVGVSVNPLPVVIRSGGADGGSIMLAKASTLAADNSIIIDSINQVMLGATIKPRGGNLRLGAKQVNLGNIPLATTGLNLTTAALARLKVKQLVISSFKPVSIYDDVNLAFSNFTLIAPGVNGISNSGSDVSLTATGNLLLRQNGALAQAGGMGNGSFSVKAANIYFFGNKNDFIFDGFNNIDFTAGQSIKSIAHGMGAFNFGAAKVVIDTPLLTGDKGSKLALTTTGMMNLINTSATKVDIATIKALGGQLKIDAARLNIDTRLVFPSGLVALHSKGPDAGDDITLGANARLDVSGRTRRYVNGSQAGSSGGWVELSSTNGNISSALGSIINIAASNVAGDAGVLRLSSVNGTALWQSRIETKNAVGFKGADLYLDVGHLKNSASFIQTIQTVGFSHKQDYRLRHGDIDLTTPAEGKANIVASNIRLTADRGKITLAGKLDASGKMAGNIEIYAADNVTLNGANLDTATKSAVTDLTAKGGKIVISTTNGAINVNAATQISLARGSRNGKLTLRAPRSHANSDIAINTFKAKVTGAKRIDLEGVAVYNNSNISQAEQAIYKQDITGWLANRSVMAVRLGLNTDNRVHFIPGVEIVSNGNISISDPLDFYQWQVDTLGVIDAGSFTVRAAKQLNINASISDAVSTEALYSLNFGGFVFPGPIVPVLKPSDSWNYRLVSGADMSSANPMAYNRSINASSENLTLAHGVTVRTGTGDINMASGGNLILTDQTSVIYTAGTPHGSGKFDSTTLDLSGLPDGPVFPDNGGDIRLTVAHNIDTVASDQFFTDWLQRIGGNSALGVSLPAMWGVVLKDFSQGVATLGGGDINVYAGGNINNLSLSTPTTGQLNASNKVIVRGGGNISVYAGGNYFSGRILSDGGSADFRVRGNMVASTNGLNSLLALGNASARIETGGDVAIDGIANINTLPLSRLQVNPSSTKRSYFFTYTKQNRIDLVAQYGDIILNNDTRAIKNTVSNLLGDSSGDPFSAWSIYPGNLSAAALTGDIRLNNSFTMYPDINGNLQLLAAHDILSRNTGNANTISLSMSDVAVADLPTLINPDNSFLSIDNHLLGDPTNQSLRHAIAGPVHRNDTVAALIVANRNITTNDPLKIQLSKQVHVYAGGNIKDLALDIQQNNSTDKSTVIAGGDIVYSPAETGVPVNAGMRVTGPGALQIVAGGNVDLGASKGIRSMGNIDNAALPKIGAKLSVFSGVSDQLNTKAFITTYFGSDKKGEARLVKIDVASYQQQLIKYITSAQFDGDIVSAISQVTARTYANRKTAITAFKQLGFSQQIKIARNSFSASPVREQRNLLLKVLFSEIDRAASEQAKSGNKSAYARGFLAINKLFNTSSRPAGQLKTGRAIKSHYNIRLPFSRILSTSGGDINLLAPKGTLTVGFTAEVRNTSANVGALGVIVSGKGNLSALTEGNISVNLSRMLTLDGGDISLWSSSGNIDAGRGAKSKLTIPPPLTLVDKKTGQISVTFPPAVQGSGIGAAAFSAGQTPGTVILAAPGGVINASDAGIRSAGNLILSATKVLGGDNITAGGVSVGVPIATNVTASLSGLSSSTDNAINVASGSISSALAQSSANRDMAIVTVEFLGAGRMK